MWIIPKNLRTFLSVQDTEESTSDYSKPGSILSSLFMWRSKPSPPSTWQRRLKANPWVRELYGLILKPSHSEGFEEDLISCLVDFRASRLVKLEKEKATKTPATSSHTSSKESESVSLASLSSKTSKGLCPPSSKGSIGEIQPEHPFCFMSSESWKEWVTEQRQSRRARQKSALLTSGIDGSLSAWPTVKTRDWKDTLGCSLDAKNPDGSPRDRRDRLVGAIAAELGQPAPDKINTNGSRPELLNGKLNPRWVETLMNLPVGWVMPNCKYPVAIVPMNSGYLETDAFRLPLHGRSGRGLDNSFREIVLSSGELCKVDEEYFEFLNQWRWKFLSANGCAGGYAARNGYNAKDKKFIGILMHRLINNTPEGEITDHINGDKLDNRRGNLRTATASENMHNRGKQKNNSSGIKGVCYDKSRSRWKAALQVEGITVLSKRFPTKEEAEMVYLQAVAEHSPAPMPSEEGCESSWPTPAVFDTTGGPV